MAICSVAQQAIESTFRLFIERKLKSLLSDSNLAYLIKLLEGVIFEGFVSSTTEEIKELKIKAFDELNRAFPSFLVKILGDEVRVGANNILEIFQNPIYNKQVSFYLNCY